MKSAFQLFPRIVFSISTYRFIHVFFPLNTLTREYLASVLPETRSSLSHQVVSSRDGTACKENLNCSPWRHCHPLEPVLLRGGMCWKGWGLRPEGESRIAHLSSLYDRSVLNDYPEVCVGFAARIPNPHSPVKYEATMVNPSIRAKGFRSLCLLVVLRPKDLRGNDCESIRFVVGGRQPDWTVQGGGAAFFKRGRF